MFVQLLRNTHKYFQGNSISFCIIRIRRDKPHMTAWVLVWLFFFFFCTVIKYFPAIEFISLYYKPFELRNFILLWAILWCFLFCWSLDCSRLCDEFCLWSVRDKWGPGFFFFDPQCWILQFEIIKWDVFSTASLRKPLKIQYRTQKPRDFF